MVSPTEGFSRQTAQGSSMLFDCPKQIITYDEGLFKQEEKAYSISEVLKQTYTSTTDCGKLLIWPLKHQCAGRYFHLVQVAHHSHFCNNRSFSTSSKIHKDNHPTCRYANCYLLCTDQKLKLMREGEHFTYRSK
jgi:hypothetical protein